MKPSTTSLSVCALLLAFASCVASQEVDDEKDFNYVPGSGKGPEDWGNLREEWSLCRDGVYQSPIDFRDSEVSKILNSDGIFQSKRAAPAVLKNRGHDVALEWPQGAGWIDINGIKYALKQLHWHTPSEHKINGKRFCAEMHMVHQSADNQIAVVGVLFHYGFSGDPLLHELREQLCYLAEKRANMTDVGPISPWDLQGRRDYYRYMGSLTTPPCTEGVKWTVLRQIMSITSEQVILLRKAVHDGFENNARPIQPVNGRLIEFYMGPHLEKEHASS